MQVQVLEKPQADQTVLERLASEVRGSVHAQRLLKTHASWQYPDGRYCEFYLPSTNQRKGYADRDFGDIVPYLWLLSPTKAEQYAKTLDAHYDFGIISDNDQYRSFDNLDYVFGYYLLYRLTSAGEWANRFLAIADELVSRFCGDGGTPEFVRKSGARSIKQSAFSLGILEIAAFAYGLGGGKQHHDAITVVLQKLLKVKSNGHEPRALQPRWRLETPFFSPSWIALRGKAPFRLFKDNANWLHSLIEIDRHCPTAESEPLLHQLIPEIVQTFYRAFPPESEAIIAVKGKLEGTRPSLIGLPLAFDLDRVLHTSQELASLWPEPARRSFIDAALAWYDGADSIVLAESNTDQHLDIAVDLATAAIQNRLAFGQKRSAKDILYKCRLAVEQHASSKGYMTFPPRPGGGDIVCVKYNFLLLKLDICDYVIRQYDFLPDADLRFLSDIFLVDR
ncbi:MAG: hypothetical protein AAFR21_13685 [Pseudomonadota bacterium]